VWNITDLAMIHDFKKAAIDAGFNHCTPDGYNF